MSFQFLAQNETNYSSYEKKHKNIKSLILFGNKTYTCAHHLTFPLILHYNLLLLHNKPRKKYTYQVQNVCNWNISKFKTHIQILVTEAVSVLRYTLRVTPTEHSENLIMTQHKCKSRDALKCSSLELALVKFLRFKALRRMFPYLILAYV